MRPTINEGNSSNRERKNRQKRQGDGIYKRKAGVGFFIY